MLTRVCSNCNIEKEITEFYRSHVVDNVIYYHYNCKSCSKELNKIARKSQPEKYHNIDRSARIKPKKRFSTAQTAAKKRNLIWELSYAEFLTIIEQPCYYCNFELGNPVTAGSGLDRIDNNKGYELTNVVSCCGFCNKLRNNILSPEETKIAVQAVISFRRNKKELINE